jgi:hypothetical protein
VSIDVPSTREADRVAIITLGSLNRGYFDAEMGDALTAAERVEALLKQGLQRERDFELHWPAVLDSLLEK